MKRGMVALGVAAAAAVAALWWLPMQRPYEGRIQAILEVEGVAAADMARPAVLEVRRGNTVQVRQPVTLSLGSTTFPVGRGSADTSLWDRIELKEVGAGPPLKVKMTVRAGHGAAMVQGDLSEASSLVLERPGTEFEGYLRRWRLRVPVLAGLIGGLVFLAFKSSRAGHAARVALVVIAGVVLLRLFKPENVQERDQWWVVLASDLLIAGAAAWVLALLGRAFGVLKRRPEPAPLSLSSRRDTMAGLFFLFAIPLVFWFIGEYPGHPFFDEAQMYDAALRFEAQPWLCTIYSVYAVSVLRVTGQYLAIVVLNIAILSWVLADFFSLLLALGVRRWVVFVCSALVATSIPLGLLSISLSHDIFTSFLKIALVVAVVKVSVRAALLGPAAVGGKASHAALWAIGALVLALSSLRGENVALLAYIPLMLLATGAARGRAVAVLSACLLAGALLYRGVVRPGLEGPAVAASDMSRRYTVYLMYGPVGFMIKNNYYTTTPAEDRRDISAVVNYDEFVAKYNSFDFLRYASSTKREVTKEGLRGFRRVYITSALNNPGLFLAHRLMVFMRCFEGNPYIWFSCFPHREEKPVEVLHPAPFGDIFALHGMTFERENPHALARLTHRLRDWAYPHGFDSPGYYLWNGVPAAILTLLGVLSFRRLPVTASACGVIAAPLVLFALAVPNPMFKYITDLYVFGFMVVPIALLEAGPLRRLVRTDSARG